MKLAKTAAVVAFLMAGLSILSALMGTILLLPLALIPLTAGIGILRRGVWSAYGFALFQFVQLLILAIVIIRTGASGGALPVTLGTMAVSMALVVLFVLAGRAVQTGNGKRGLAWPWIVASILCAAPLTFGQAFVIPTGAMEDTILIGDHIYVQRLPRRLPARDELVVFVYPADRRQTFVKRVVGVAGDRIHISNKTVYRNGIRLEEPYAVHKNNFPDAYRDNFPSEPNDAFLLEPGREMLTKHSAGGEIVVPDRSYFVLGDNRDNSLDSRYWGFVTADDVIGKPLIIYDSEEPPDGKPALQRVRWGRLLKVL